MTDSECCKVAAKEAVKAERRKVREALAKLDPETHAKAIEAIFGPQTTLSQKPAPKWVDMSATEQK
jgi:hypothetical protein